MRLYIPEIKDHLRLEEDWTFDLLQETRNMDLWTPLKLDDHPACADWKRQRDEVQCQINVLDNRRIEVPNPHRNMWPGAPQTMMVHRDDADRQEHARLWRILNWDLEAPTAPVTLPKGTILRVDRIYIRQGMEGFSSVSFYITETSHPDLQPVKTAKGFKKGRKRFFAHLRFVNQMMVQQVAAPEGK